AQHRDVRREGRETRGDRLPVADVGEDAGVQREPGVRPDRRNHAALRQQRQQPHRLDEHGLAAGVRSRDQHRELIGRKLEIEWHHCLAPRPPLHSLEVLTPCPPPRTPEAVPPPPPPPPLAAPAPLPR